MRIKASGDDLLERAAIALNLAPLPAGFALYGLTAGRMIGVAQRVGIFAQLLPEPATARRLAEELELQVAGTRLLCENLAGSDVLEQDGHTFSLPKRSRKWLDPSSDTYIGTWLEHTVTYWEWYGDLEGKEPATGLPGPVLDALLDDLNTPKAIAEMHKLHSAGHGRGLRAALAFLGFSGDQGKIERVRARDRQGISIAPKAKVDALISARNAARAAKNFKEADRIRDELEAMGITLKDAKDPKTGELVTTWEVAR